MEEGRAAYAAQLLASEGHGVVWEPKTAPNTVKTSAERSVVRELLKKNGGVIAEWFKLAPVNTNMRRENDGFVQQGDARRESHP